MIIVFEKTFRLDCLGVRCSTELPAFKRYVVVKLLKEKKMPMPFHKSSLQDEGTLTLK